MSTTEIDELLKNLVCDVQHAAEQIERLQGYGYRTTFRRSGNKLVCLENNRRYAPTDLEIDAFYEISLDDVNHYYIYALSGPDSATKGIFAECPAADTEKTMPA